MGTIRSIYKNGRGDKTFMNILLSIPDDKTANYYLVNALQDLGHSVFYINHRINVGLAKVYVNEMLGTKKIDCIIVGHFVAGQTYDKHYLQLLKNNYPNVKLIALFFDTYVDGMLCWENKHFIPLMQEYHLCFSVSDLIVQYLKGKNVNSKKMFFGFDSALTPWASSDKIKDIDISFIGQFGYQNNVVHRPRLEYLDRICREFDNVQIYGSCGMISDNIGKKYMGRGTYNDYEYARIISRSKISFGYSDSGDGVPLCGFSNRVVHTLGFGGFLMYNRIPLLEKEFVDGKDLILYDNINDFLEKAHYYISNDRERNAIAETGRNKVHTQYLWEKSLSMILEVLND